MLCACAPLASEKRGRSCRDDGPRPEPPRPPPARAHAAPPPPPCLFGRCGLGAARPPPPRREAAPPGRAAGAPGVSAWLPRCYTTTRLTAAPPPRPPPRTPPRAAPTRPAPPWACAGARPRWPRSPGGLWRDAGRPSREVKTITARHIADLEGRIAEMQSMVSALKHLASHCRGNDRPDCPILDGLSGAHPGVAGNPGERP